MLAILDYRAGNQTSVLRALRHLGIPAEITADPSVIGSAEGLVFPGVGSAGRAMDVLKEQGLDRCLARAVASGQPLLGICLGCQILLESSEEGNVPTLGLVPGRTRKFPDGLRLEDGSPAPVPHMGWNSVRPIGEGTLLEGVDPRAQFYFVHSYYVEPDPSLVLGMTRYGGMEFCSVYGRPGLWATQFHPEKSGRAGLAMLRNFHAHCKEAARAL